MSSLGRPPVPVAALAVDARATFITRTYLHLYGAVLGFTLFEAALFMSGLALPIARALSSRWTAASSPMRVECPRLTNALVRAAMTPRARPWCS